MPPGHRIKHAGPKYKALICKSLSSAVIPQRKTSEAAAYDVYAAEGFSLRPGERVTVRTGLIIQPDPGLHTELVVRSGLAAKHNIFLSNCVGLIDRDFCGSEDEVKVMLYRGPIFAWDGDDFVVENKEPIFFKEGDRIAQILFRETCFVEFEVIDQAPGHEDRGGFGSTGLR